MRRPACARSGPGRARAPAGRLPPRGSRAGRARRRNRGPRGLHGEQLRVQPCRPRRDPQPSRGRCREQRLRSWDRLSHSVGGRTSSDSDEVENHPRVFPGRVDAPAPAGGLPAKERRILGVPLLQGVLPFGPEGAKPEIVAGMTLAALGIPEVMGYARIGGMPVVTGLYTILIPIAVFAIFGSSRHLVVGADSATAAIMAAGLAGLAAAGSSHYVELAGILAVLTAGVLVLARLCRLGFVANFLSRSVLIGFLTGVGIQVAMGQLAAMLGVSAASGG